MTKFAILAAASAVALLAMPAAAHAQAYAGLGYTALDTDAGDIGAVTGRLGYRINPNFAVEGEASFGVDDDGVELDNNIGAYAVAILPVSNSFDLHGRVGYQRSEFDSVFGGGDDDGLGYGVGATFRATPNFGIRADYTRWDGDFESDAISLGGVVNF